MTGPTAPAAPTVPAEPTASLVARLAARDPAPRRVQVTRVVDLDAASTFPLLADVRNHERWIPLTHGRYPMTASGPLPAGPFPVGTRFTMVSGPGMPDRMIVTEVRAASPASSSDKSPGETTGRTTSQITLRKAGPVLFGTAGITVEPAGAARARVTWWEDAYLAGPVPARVTRAVVGPVLAAMMRLALARFAREVAPA